MNFNPGSVDTFRFVSCEFDEKNAIARLRYAFDNNHFFTEEFEFPGADVPTTGKHRAALENCLLHLHLAAGISYYKAAVPKKIVVENANLSRKTARFFNKLYLNGLGEFAYRNDLDLQSRICFPFSRVNAVPVELKLPRKTAVPVGGGKDSVVAVEVLNACAEPMVLFSVGNFRPIEEVARVAGISKITVLRRLSPKLFELNAAGALNGHVPISAIIAFTLAVSSVLYGFDVAAMANERSASVGNLNYLGREINHQYSKSLDFERDFSGHLQSEVIIGFRYFSLLRPLSELAIARLFSKCLPYQQVFTSCNSAFKLRGEGGRWCRKCPKCRFVFLALAPFIDKQALISAFGSNLLDQEKQTAGYDELTGRSGHKPFECVGEVEESLAAFALLKEQSQWTEDLLVRRYGNLLTPEKGKSLVRRALAFSRQHSLLPGYEEKLRAYMRT